LVVLRTGNVKIPLRNNKISKKLPRRMDEKFRRKYNDTIYAQRKRCTSVQKSVEGLWRITHSRQYGEIKNISENERQDISGTTNNNEKYIQKH
jgi:hypothetical protein